MESTPLPDASFASSSSPSHSEHEVGDSENATIPSSPLKVCAVCTNALHATLIFRSTFIIKSQKNVDSVMQKIRTRLVVKQCRRSDIAPDCCVVMLKPFSRLEFKNGLCGMRQKFDDSTLNYIKLNETEKNIKEGFLLDTRCVGLTENAKTLMNDVKKVLYNPHVNPDASRAKEFEGILHFLANLASLSLQRQRESTLTTEPTLFLITNEILIGLGFHRNNIRKIFKSIEQRLSVCVVDVDDVIHRKEYKGMTIFNPIEAGTSCKTCIAISVDFLPVALSKTRNHSAMQLCSVISTFFFVYMTNKYRSELDRRNEEIRGCEKTINSMKGHINQMHQEMEATIRESEESAAAEHKEREEILKDTISTNIELYREIDDLKAKLAASHEKIEAEKKETEKFKQELEFRQDLEELLDETFTDVRQEIQFAERRMENGIRDMKSRISQVVSELLKINNMKEKILPGLVENGTEPSILVEGMSDRVEVLALFIIREDSAAASSSTAGDEKVYTYKLLSKSRKDGNFVKATVDLLKTHKNLNPVGIVIGCNNSKMIIDYLVNKEILKPTIRRCMDSSLKIDEILSIVSSIVGSRTIVLGRGNNVFVAGENMFENLTPQEDTLRFEFYEGMSLSRKRTIAALQKNVVSEAVATRELPMRPNHVLSNNYKRPRLDVL